MKNGLRIAAASIVAVLLAFSAFAQALVTVTHSRNPDLALKLHANDPVALVRKAQADFAAKPERRTADRAIAAAQESIRRLPLNPNAFQLLGLAFQDSGDLDVVHQRLAFSARLSRRNLRTHLSLIEDEVRENDVAGVLDLYDTALRSSPAAESLLFPVLTRALDEPAIRRRLVPYLQSPPPWMQAFLRTAVSTSTNPKSIAALALEAGGFPEDPAYQTFNAQLIRRLVDAGDHAEAIEFYRRTSGQSGEILTDAEMTLASTDPRFSPLTWQPFTLDGIDASFVAAGQDQVQLDAHLESIFSGPVVHKVFRLPPGQYALAVTHSSENPGPRSQVTWKIRCEGEGEPVWPLVETAPLEAETVVGGSFAVGPSCPIQVFTLVATAGVESGSLDMLVGPVELVRR